MDAIMERIQDVFLTLTETLQSLPYYPYSAIGIGAAILLLLLLLLLMRGRSPKKKKKSAAPPMTGRGKDRVPVRGLAVDGLRQSGDIDEKIVEDIKNSPMGRIVLPQEEAPQKPPVDPQLIEQAVKACQAKYQEMYIEMYIGLGLMSDFERLRTEVSRRLADGQETYHAISELKLTPEGVVLMQMASVAGNILQTGEQHIGKGLLGIHGQELHSVYRYALTTMQEKGMATVEETQSKLNHMERRIKELG